MSCPHVLPPLALSAHAALAHAWAWLSTRPEPDVARHSVLHVAFDPDRTPCPIGNAQTLAADEALVCLRDGSSWAVIVCCGRDMVAANSWLMRARLEPASAHAALVVLVPEVASREAVSALRAGADVVLPRDAPRDLLQAQLARLRERLAPPPAGDLSLGHGLLLHAATRELRIGQRRCELQPQTFRLLWALGAEDGRVVSAAALRVALDIPARAADEALHTAIGRLRRSLRPHDLSERVQTVHGAGYRWNPAVDPRQH